MNIIKIEGTSEAYPELVDGTIEWYFCQESKNCFCDLYEAEEIVKLGGIFYRKCPKTSVVYLGG